MSTSTSKGTCTQCKARNVHVALVGCVGDFCKVCTERVLDSATADLQAKRAEVTRAEKRTSALYKTWCALRTADREQATEGTNR